MNISCAKLVESALRELEVGFDCATHGDRLSVVTPFLHPDDAYVEVFVEERPGGRIVVSDLGETLRHLANLGFDVTTSSRAKFLLEQTAKRFELELWHGRIQKEGALEDVGQILLDVVAGAQAAGSLVYLSKAYEPATYPKEVSLFLDDNQLDHEYKVPIMGTTGKRYFVSIRIHRTKYDLLIEPMSPAQRNTMTAMVNRVFRMWSDVNGHTHKLSLLNDIDFEWTLPDVRLLERVSTVEKWSLREQLVQRIKADGWE
jgi:hypothetical protein